MATDLISVTIEDGKYTVRQHAPGRWEALRNGEHWPAMASGPDNLHVALASELFAAWQALAVLSQWSIDVSTIGEFADLERRLAAVGITLQQVGQWSAKAGA